MSYNDIPVQYLRSFTFLPTTVSFDALAEVFPWDVGYESWYKKLVTGLPGCENCVILRLLVLS